MRSITWSLPLCCLAAPVLGGEPEPDLKLVAARYVAAQEAVMERDAGPADVETLISFYAPDYAYYHPSVGAKVTGLDTVRRGISSHLGETRDAEIDVKGILRHGDTFSVATETRFTVVADGKIIVRPGMMVLTFKDGKIVQRIDI